MFLTLNSKPPFSLAPPPPLFFSFSFISLYKASCSMWDLLFVILGIFTTLFFQFNSILKARKNNNCPIFFLLKKRNSIKKIEGQHTWKMFLFHKELLEYFQCQRMAPYIYRNGGTLPLCRGTFSCGDLSRGNVPLLLKGSSLHDLQIHPLPCGLGMFNS